MRTTTGCPGCRAKSRYPPSANAAGPSATSGQPRALSMNCSSSTVVSADPGVGAGVTPLIGEPYAATVGLGGGEEVPAYPAAVGVGVATTLAAYSPVVGDGVA